MSRTFGGGILDPAIIAAIVGGACALLTGLSGLRVIAEFERGVVLRMGRRGPLLEPGLRWVLPLGIDRLTRVDLRSTLLEIPVSEVFTADGVPLRVGATVHIQVLNAMLAVTRVADYRAATLQLVHAAIRDAVGQVGLRTVLVDQEAVRARVGAYVDPRAEPWGVGVTEIDVSEIGLPAAMRQAMEQQADMQGRKQVEAARTAAELATAHRLVASAEILARQPHAVQLRFLEALTQMSSDKGTVMVVPLPTELVQPFVDLQGRITDDQPSRVTAAAPPPQPADTAQQAQPSPTDPGAELPEGPRRGRTPDGGRAQTGAVTGETTIKGRAQPR